MASSLEVPGPGFRLTVRSRLASFVGSAVGHKISADACCDPLLEKLTEDHITKIIEQSRGDSEAGRRYRTAYTVIGLVAFFVLTIYMIPVGKELYTQLVQRRVLGH